MKVSWEIAGQNERIPISDPFTIVKDFSEFIKTQMTPVDV
jgi:hypothetical protein